MLQLSSLYRIDQGFNKWDLKMYRFRQFCMRFSVLIEFFFGFSVLDDFSTVFRFLIGPNAPLLNENQSQNIKIYIKIAYK